MLVFPSPKGKPIDATNFLNRAWQSVLKKCGMTQENGLLILTQESGQVI
jgi:integrase